jgi:hypothetical protein
VVNLQGSIISTGSILVASATFTAPNGAFVQAYTDSLQHFGDAPYTIWDEVAAFARANPGTPVPQALIDAALASGNTLSSGFIFGDDVFISSRYVNLNGVIQSGISDYMVTIDPAAAGAHATVANQIAAAISAAEQYRSNPSGSAHATTANGAGIQANSDWTVFKLDTGSASHNIGVWFNTALNRIEIDPVTVKGGHMEIYGEILSTGNGELRLMDGFGRIKIDNKTAYDTVIWPLSTGIAGPRGEGIEGFLKITDLGKLDASVATTTGTAALLRTALVTEYTRIGHDVDINKYRNPTGNAFARDADGNPIGVITLTGGTNEDSREASYDPASGKRYFWVQGQNFSTEIFRKYGKASWLGLDSWAPDPSDVISVTGPTTVGGLEILNGEAGQYIAGGGSDGVRAADLHHR